MNPNDPSQPGSTEPSVVQVPVQPGRDILGRRRISTKEQIAAFVVIVLVIVVPVVVGRLT